MPVDRPVIAIRPQGTHLAKQHLPNFERVSGSTMGSQHLCMHLVIIPPGVPHQLVNLRDTEQVIAVAARNDPNEQESVVLYPTQEASSSPA